MLNRSGTTSTALAKLSLLACAWMTVTMQTGIAQAIAGQGRTATGTYVPTLTFDVASIRQSPEADSYTVSGGFVQDSSLFRVTNFDILNLLIMAYGIQSYQLSGAPDLHAMFNIEAKSDSAANAYLAKLNKDQKQREQQHMMQALLAERFNLKAHWETREGPIYNLVTTKGALKMAVAKGKSPGAEERKTWGDTPVPDLYQRGDSGSGFDFVAHGCSMSELTQMLAGQFGHPVLDKTRLTGKYDFTLHYKDIRWSDRDANDTNPVSPLETAIQDQLGLKLEAAKGPVQVLVIDRIQKPSEN